MVTDNRIDLGYVLKEATEMKDAELISVGFGHFINAAQIEEICSWNNASIKRVVGESRHDSLVIDLTSGRRTLSYILMRDGRIVLSALSVAVVSKRVLGQETANLPGKIQVVYPF